MFHGTTASSVVAFANLQPIVRPLHHGATTTTALQALSPTRTAARIAFMALQSGAAYAASGKPVLDMNRVRIRLDGLHSYAVICTLLLNAALRLYSATPKKLDKKPDPEDGQMFYAGDVVKVIFMVSTITSVVAGTYTTVVFTLIDLYAKTALGLGCDAPYLDFFAQTSSYRKTAFDAFVLALVAFETSFVSSLFLAYDKKLRSWAAGLAGVFALFCFWQWGSIMAIAGRLLF